MKSSKASAEPVLSQKSFSQKLEGQTLVKAIESGSRRVYFRGIRLRPKDDEPEAWLDAHGEMTSRDIELTFDIQSEQNDSSESTFSTEVYDA